MKLLLINPNRYKHPPVMPLALEYLAGALADSPHTCDLLDLCFSPAPEKELARTLASHAPDVAGITIRQVDTALYPEPECFLPDIRKLVQTCKTQGCTTLLGGAGFSIMPGAILDYTGADYGITGPGEAALVNLLDLLQHQQTPPRIMDGYAAYLQNKPVHRRRRLTREQPYLKQGGIAGFRTQIGCTATCMFCTEAAKPLIFHDPGQVAMEIRALKETGHRQLHLCDSEFNMDLSHCIDICKAMVSLSGPIQWALYMKPAPYSRDLFAWLARSGAHMLTLSLNTWDYPASASLAPLAEFIHLATEHHLKIAVDLSTGFPCEPFDSASRVVSFLDQQPVETIGINAYFRVYPGTRLARLVHDDPALTHHLIHPDSTTPAPASLQPFFFHYYDLETLQQITRDQTKCRIEGFEKASNYQRVAPTTPASAANKPHRFDDPLRLNPLASKITPPRERQQKTPRAALSL